MKQMKPPEMNINLSALKGLTSIGNTALVKSLDSYKESMRRVLLAPFCRKAFVQTL